MIGVTGYEFARRSVEDAAFIRGWRLLEESVYFTSQMRRSLEEIRYLKTFFLTLKQIFQLKKTLLMKRKKPFSV